MIESREKRPSAIVVGGGWSGISAAWKLVREGFAVAIYDDGTTLGGRSASETLRGRSVCLGGKNIGRRYSLFREFARAFDVEAYEHFGISSSRIDGGRVVPVDGHRRVRAIARYLRHARLGDVRQFARLQRAIKDHRSNSFLGGLAFAEAAGPDDIRLSSAFSPYVVDNLIRPMTVRMNGAEPAETYLGNFGTNLSLILDSFEQLTGGFDALFERFSRVVDVHLGHTVDELRIAGNSVSGIVARDSDGSRHDVDADLVVLAVPARAAARLLGPGQPKLGGVLREVRYFPVGVLVVDYDRDVFPVDRRALVFPKESVISNAGAYGLDELNVVRYTFSGAEARNYLDSSPSAEDLLQTPESALDPYVPVRGARARGSVARMWSHGLCAYGPSHGKRLELIHRAVADIRGLGLAGDYMRGASLEACFQAGSEAAEAATRTRLKAGGSLP